MERRKVCHCGKPTRAAGQRYCKDCHASYMRRWRPLHPLNPEQHQKDICRSYAGSYLRRGKIEKQPCSECGDPTSEMHHTEKRA